MVKGEEMNNWKKEYQQYPNGTHCCVALENGDWIADCGLEGDNEAEANAHLIAAAPEMYEALSLWKDVFFTHAQHKPIKVKVNRAYKATAQALAKAEGLPRK